VDGPGFGPGLSVGLEPPRIRLATALAAWVAMPGIMKGSVEVEALGPVGLNFYAGICGWTLARAHARSGDPIAIAAYLGEGDQFDRAVTEFAERYADQNERDYQAFAQAIRSGRLPALEGL
jgi:Uncharacterized protein conserved in bacteria (DUF2252)